MKRLKLLLGMAALACRVIELDVNGARGELAAQWRRMNAAGFTIDAVREELALYQHERPTPVRSCGMRSAGTRSRTKWTFRRSRRLRNTASSCFAG